MKTIKQDELFQSLSEFLKVKGIELKDGAYAQRIRQACNLLGDTINRTRQTAKKAKDKVDRRLEQVRQSIHEATAPTPPVASAPKPASSAAPQAKKAGTARKRAAAAEQKARKK